MRTCTESTYILNRPLLEAISVIEQLKLAPLYISCLGVFNL